MRFQATVISLGRITIPEATRRALKLKEGDIVDMEIKKVNGK